METLTIKALNSEILKVELSKKLKNKSKSDVNKLITKIMMEL